MDYAVVGICIVTVAVVVALLIYRKKKMSVSEGVNESPNPPAMLGRIG